MIYKIWDKEEPLKGLPKEVWFKEHPQTKTLTPIFFGENENYSLLEFKEILIPRLGLADTATADEVAKEYIRVQEEQQKKQQEEQTSLQDRIEALEQDKLNLSLANIELIEQIEREKQELALANVELLETLTQANLELEARINKLENGEPTA